MNLPLAHLSATFLLGAALAAPNPAIAQSSTVDVPLQDGVAKITTTTVPTLPQTIKVLGGKALQRLRTMDAPARGFLVKYQPGGTPPSLKAYDRAFRAWKSDRASRYTAKQVVEMLGAVLGNAAVDRLGMEWVLLTDAQGTDYAVQSKTVEVTAFPFSSVQKRVQSGEQEFLAGVYEAIRLSLLEKGNRQRTKAGAKPQP